MAKPQPQAEIVSVRHSKPRNLLLASLLSRRSVSSKQLVEPGPNPSEIRQMVAAALTAPDHCALRPWRFILISGAALDGLGDVFATIKAHREPDASEEELRQERARALRAPALIAVIAKITRGHQRVRICEQHASVGAAIQNILLCAHVLGYGAKMVSGRKVLDPQLTAALGLGSHEQLFGFICLGTPIRPTSPKKRPDVDDHLSDWRPPSNRA